MSKGRLEAFTDAVMAILEFESGPLGYIGTGWASPGVYSVNLLGTKANLMYDLDFPHWDESHQADDWSTLRSQFYGESVRQPGELPRTDMFRAQLEEFALATRGEATVAVRARAAGHAPAGGRPGLEAAARGGQARLVEQGVRFVQLFSWGAFGSPRINWDGHENMAQNHGQEALRVDQPLAALLIGFIPPSQFGSSNAGVYVVIVAGGALGLLLSAVAHLPAGLAGDAALHGHIGREVVDVDLADLRCREPEVLGQRAQHVAGADLRELALVADHARGPRVGAGRGGHSGDPAVGGVLPPAAAAGLEHQLAHEQTQRVENQERLASADNALRKSQTLEAAGTCADMVCPQIATSL